jgi:hypothetical protein
MATRVVGGLTHRRNRSAVGVEVEQELRDVRLQAERRALPCVVIVLLLLELAI